MKPLLALPGLASLIPSDLLPNQDPCPAGVPVNPSCCSSSPFVGAIVALATCVMALIHAPNEAEACSGSNEIRLAYTVEDGDVTARQPELLFSASAAAPVSPQEFTLTGPGGQTYPVTTRKIANILFGAWYTVQPAAPLAAGTYTLTYETVDSTVLPPPGQPAPTYESSVSFVVEQTALHPQVLEVGLDWSRLRAAPDDLVFQDSCGGSNAEQHEVTVSMGNACRTHDAGIYHHVDYTDASGQVLYSQVHRVPDADLIVSDPQGLIESTFSARSQGGALADCIRVTAFTTSGVVGDSVELCVPTRCATGTRFPSEDQHTSCPNPSNLPTQIVLDDPYPAAACMLASGFDPCDGVRCATGMMCVEGQCVAVDPCEGVMCGDEEMCVDGQCTSTAPCAGVTCEAGETCTAGQCVAVDPCDGVMCGADEMCVDGQCASTTVEPDPCAAVSCGAGEMCHEGTCFVQVDQQCMGVSCPDGEICHQGDCYRKDDGDGMAGGDQNPTPPPPPSPSEESSCHAAPAHRPGTGWAWLGLVALAALVQRRRRGAS